MTISVPLSILDLSRIRPGETVSDSISRSVRLAQAADALGYNRVWFSEHHNTSSIASAATSLVIQHVAALTNRIRVGAGGIMLPNHSPMVVAEQFGTLAALYPERIDLGLGRAPGTDLATVRALRRTGREAQSFPDDVVELHGLLSQSSPIPGVEAHPGSGSEVPLFILGSSMFGAHLAAQLGLPYAFASHFAPAMLHEAARVYRQNFDTEGPLAPAGATPWFMAAVNVIAADSADDAREQQAKTEDEWLQSALGRVQQLDADQLAAVRHHPQGQQVLAMLSQSYVGEVDTVTDGLDRLAAEIKADEFILVNMAHDEAYGLRALELLAPVAGPVGQHRQH
ncbi:LLM class flavin-dependent oxidoreductase [Microbacterium sp. NPDC079995]|uniref:LLM class flavin-dependent oxidoreductase n=1 Tax=unclassified Microbacterium TaxID=2609290 RepID=UPI00345066BF